MTPDLIAAFWAGGSLMLVVICLVIFMWRYGLFEGKTHLDDMRKQTKGEG